jgi:succinate dehydrogenase / fumarate reductase iron-sulfur subunit
MCKSRLDDFDLSKEIRVYPMKSFPLIKDLVCNVSWNYEVNKKIIPFTPKPNTDWTMSQRDIDRVQEFRKCIECFACQNVCHVIRDHDLKPKFAGPRFFVRVAGLEMHPLDNADRLPALKDDMGISLCNITKCCTEVCPEDIHITDNAIIPLKERVVDRFYDPLKMFFRMLFGKK